MVEIFLAGVLVSFVKLMAYGDIGIGSSFVPYCLFCLLQVRAFQCVDRRWLWQDIEPAPRLDRPLTVGRTGMRRGRALLRLLHGDPAGQSGALPALPHQRLRAPPPQPAVDAGAAGDLHHAVYPGQPDADHGDRGAGQQDEFHHHGGGGPAVGSGSYPVAMVIFIASIMVPSLKMLAIGWLCWDANGRKKPRADSERMHLIYEVVEFVGRWSMIDVFVIAVLSALVRMGQLMSIYPATGAVLFALVVILTMFAAMTFDPRLTRDRASETINKEPQGDGK